MTKETVVKKTFNALEKLKASQDPDYEHEYITIIPGKGAAPIGAKLALEIECRRADEDDVKDFNFTLGEIISTEFYIWKDGTETDNAAVDDDSKESIRKALDYLLGMYM